MTPYQQIAIARTKRFDTLEFKYRRAKGVHPAFPWSEWAVKARAGALWSELELEVAKLYIERRYNGITKLSEMVFVELAWIHGRSANGVFNKMRDFLGYKAFNKMIGVQ